ncbi:MAG: tRNA (adenosine(37)-N6)-threonylcarbamoyltransferase complex transferase subunit TsaD [Fimbriimonadaceae bacterium]|nr:tRNA (adenosine(37)-N6)-threonylcarbamoyltransferase complex transferase subunit TsaD [Fimbriimonadaceae bacterium]
MSLWFEGSVLGMDTSCDETAAAVVRKGKVLTNVVASQAQLHSQWGGIVPEAAARAHIESLVPVLAAAVEGAVPDAVAVTNRPGLVGALAVGVAAAEALSLAWDVPLIGVHHLEGHILSVLANRDLPPLPHLCLVVSGGHTELIEVLEPCKYRTVAETLDDAAGEAFDKCARLLGLGYPGGAALEALARAGTPGKYKLPVAIRHDPRHFSFSGLKTAAMRLVEAEGASLDAASAALAVQSAIVASLTEKIERALRVSDAATVSLVGGVAANSALRTAVESVARGWGRGFVASRPDLSTDNGAMIAIAGSIRLARGERSTALDVSAQAPIPDCEPLG